MACSNFIDCLTENPLVGTPAATRYITLGHLANTAINFLAFFINGLLLIFIVYQLASAVYKLIGSKDQDTYKVLQFALTNAVFGALGIVLVLSARFILVQTLLLFGITGADNVFLNVPW